MSWQPAQAALLPDGRLHLHHGPIDLIVTADAPPPVRDAAYGRAEARFATILSELAEELVLLRQPAGLMTPCQGAVARRMQQVAARLSDAADGAFLTPMATVAGAVADEVVAVCMAPGEAADAGAARRAEGLPERLIVNNGGDIAFALGAGHEMTAMLGGDGTEALGRLRIAAEDCVRGIATSGWRGRSHSLGIADAVTVLAPDAALADGAATLIASAVDLPGHAAVTRQPARELGPDSDLGDRAVTVAVGPLTEAEQLEALAAGERLAGLLIAEGLISAAFLCLRGQRRVVQGEGASGIQLRQASRLSASPSISAG